MFTPKRHRRSRKATALTEFAVVLPLLVMLVLGAVELGRAIMVQHTLHGAAQAGCRVYSVSGSTAQQVTDVIAAAMTEAGIDNYQVTYDPASKADITTTLQPVTVTVAVDFEDVSFFTPDFLTNSSISGKCTMPADATN